MLQTWTVTITWQRLGEEMGGSVSAKVVNFQSRDWVDSVQNEIVYNLKTKVNSAFKLSMYLKNVEYSNNT